MMGLYFDHKDSDHTASLMVRQMKTTYRIQGTKFTRTTNRTYTHAVVTLRNGNWYEEGYCGSEQLAQKQAQKIVNESIRFIQTSIDKIEVRPLEIIKQK